MALIRRMALIRCVARIRAGHLFSHFDLLEFIEGAVVGFFDLVGEEACWKLARSSVHVEAFAAGELFRA
jgi:hypothetical protein